MVFTAVRARGRWGAIFRSKGATHPDDDTRQWLYQGRLAQTKIKGQREATWPPRPRGALKNTVPSREGHVGDLSPQNKFQYAWNEGVGKEQNLPRV